MPLISLMWLGWDDVIISSYGANAQEWLCPIIPVVICFEYFADDEHEG